MAATADGVNGTICNALQYQHFLSSQASHNPTISCLSRGQTIGMTVSNPALSMLFFDLSRRTVGSWSVVPQSHFRDLRVYLDWRKPLSPSHVCLVKSGISQWNVRWYRKNVPRQDWKLFQRPFDIYMVRRIVINVSASAYSIHFHFNLCARRPFSDSTLCSP